MRRFLQLIALLLVALILFAVLTVIGLTIITDGNPISFVQTAIIRWQITARGDDLDQSIGTDATPIRFVIASGDTPRGVALNLFEANLIADADLFVDYLRANNLDREIEAGTYFLNQTQTIPVIAVALTDSRGSQIPFRILEGWRIEEVANAIDNNPLFGFTGADFLAVVGAGAGLSVDPAFAAQVGLPPNNSLEGFLFPDTYSLPPEITPIMLRDLLLTAFITQTNDAGIPALAEARGMTMFEVVTLASIVQREAVHLEEAPMIAGVYTNRITRGMRLDADPTVQYPLGEPGNWWKRITQADYQGVISPYNTYRMIGLPPGPIAIPGLAALSAAANPTASEFLYFQAECSGSGFHRFALTYEEHLANSCF